MEARGELLGICEAHYSSKGSKTGGMQKTKKVTLIIVIFISCSSWKISHILFIQFWFYFTVDLAK